jgi:hypothetical protein
MPKVRKRIPLLLATVILGACSLWFACREPKYNGRTLTQWFAAARAGAADATTLNDFHTAVFVLGTNHLPELVHDISFDASTCISEKLFNILPGNFTPRCALEYLLDKKSNADLRALDAMEVFRILGSHGAPAIPGLSRVALYGPFGPAVRAVDCLGYIREGAIPALIMVATNPQPQNFRAFGWLVAFTNSPEAMQIVAQNSHDPRFEVLVGPTPDATVTNSGKR